MAKPQYSGPWRKIRLEVLERDGHVCQIRSKGCTTAASEVDHIVPVQMGGAWWDKTNLRSSCKNCNLARIPAQKNEAWRTARTRIALVVGPPGAGKADYVAANKGPNDLVIDYEAIASALGHTGGTRTEAMHTATMNLRSQLIAKVRQGKLDVARCWIISANPQAEGIFPYHSVVKVDPGIDAVLARHAVHGSDARTVGLVREWYATRSGEALTVTARPTSRDW